MKATLVVLWLISVAVAYGVGHFAALRSDSAAAASIESFRAALDETNPIERSYGFSAFVRSMKEDQLPEAIEALEAERTWLTQDELKLFMLAWARYDAAGAFARVGGWPQGSREMAQAAAVYAWAFYDPEAALDAIEGAGSRFVRVRLQAELVEGWIARPDKQSLSTWIAGLDDGDSKQRYMGKLARALLREDPEVLIAWAESVPAEPDSDFKNLVVLKAMNALAHKHYLRAKTWIEEHAQEVYAQNAGAIVVRNWAQDDPKAALLWGLEALDAEQRDRAVGFSFRPWLQLEPEEAEAWLSTQVPSAALDAAVRLMAWETMGESFPVAMGWAEKIEDPQKRKLSIIDLAQKWLRSDPEAAEAWLASAAIDDEMREKIHTPQAAGRRRAGGPPHLRRRAAAAPAADAEGEAQAQ